MSACPEDAYAFDLGGAYTVVEDDHLLELTCRCCEHRLVFATSISGEAVQRAADAHTRLHWPGAPA